MPNNLYYDMFSQFGDRLNEGIREGQRMQAFSGGIPMTPDGAVDYQKLAAIFMQTGDRASALAVTRLAEAQAENRGTAAYRQQTLDLQRQQLGETARQHTETTKLGRERLAAEVAIAGRKPPDVVEIFDKDGNKQKVRWDPSTVDPEKGTPGTWVPIGGAANPVKAMSATEIKAKHEAEDAEPLLNATIADLDRAAELAPKAFTGPGAQFRGRVGSWGLPIVSDIVGGEDAAKATSELGQILSEASITKMSNTLTGVATDRDLKEFKDIVANPEIPVEQKLAQIAKMKRLAEAQREVNTQRIAEITGGAYRGRRPGAAASPGVPGEVPPVPPPGAGAQIAPYTGNPANIGPGAQPPPGAVPPGAATRSFDPTRAGGQGGPPAPNAARQRIGATYGGPMPQSVPSPDTERIQRMGEAMEAAGMPPEIIAERLRQAFGIGGQRGTPSPAPPPGTPGVPGPLPSGPRPGMAGPPQGYGPVAAQSQVPVPQMMPPQAPPPGPVPSFAGQPLGQAPGTPPGAQPPPWLPQPPPKPGYPPGQTPPPQLLY